jgi:predicted metal-dependent hydrolase
MKIIRTKRKTLALIVEQDGSLTVRAPLHTSQAAIDGFVRMQQDWIKRRQELACRSYNPLRYTEGETFLYLGKRYPLRYVDRQKQPLVLKDAFLLDKKWVPKASQAFTIWYKSQARQVIEEHLARTASQLGLRYQKLRISSARTRWGSCSSRGTLSFSWRLVMAPPDVIQYIIVHELVHLQEPNHSPKFWERVRQIIPDYAACRRWLNQHGKALTL